MSALPIRYILYAISCILFCSVMLTSDSTSAETSLGSGCTGLGGQSYTGEANVPADTYDLYVKLGAVGQTASVGVFAQSDSQTQSCLQIGSVQASGDVWEKVGSYNIRDAVDTTFQLVSPAIKSNSSLNRPTVMLVSQTNPVCVPDKECTTTILEQAAFIRPQNVSPGSSLEITHAQSFPLKEIREVRYYADNELIYRTSTLESFNLRLFPYYGSRMIRVIEYNSGQLAVIDQQVPHDREIGFWSVLFAPVYKYKNIFKIIGVIIIILIIRGLVWAYQRRRGWRLHHGLIKQNTALAFSDRYPLFGTVKDTVGRVFTRITPFVIGGVIVVVLGAGMSSYVVQLTRISGGSMEMSFSPDQIVIIEKVPVTMARLNQSNFTPRRGQVVVAYPNFGISDEQNNAGETIIKRVIGLPGDRIVIDGSKITIFNSQNLNGFDPELGAEWREDLIIADDEMHIEVQLTEDQLFVVGDNRPASIDSRHTGPIEIGQVIGTVREW